jgi:L-alanine-DL-glutamate epimerase-like enolase superfamily enzyme
MGHFLEDTRTMKITDLKCAVIGNHPVIRIVTDEGVDGWGEVESSKPYLKPHVLFYKQYLVGQDPTDVERCMMRIRRMGSFKPWGAAVSAIEMALWDLAGKAAGVPVYKLLGGKVRDKVRCYNGGIRFPLTSFEPQDFADNVQKMKESKEGFTLIKQGIGFHSQVMAEHPEFWHDELRQGPSHPNRGLMTEKGLAHMVKCVEAMKKVTGDSVGLALDCGPGWMLPDAKRFAKALEPYNIYWLEDLLTGDYVPWVDVDGFRDLTESTTTPIHTGEQMYLRNDFVQLIEKRAVSVIGPDPADMGGIAELKWVAEYADLHGILMAPHGTIDGLIGLAAHVQVGATMPQNYVAFEYPVSRESWWYDIIEGLPDPIVEKSFVKVWDTPGLGISFRVNEAKKHLAEEDKDFFD